MIAKESGPCTWGKDSPSYRSFIVPLPVLGRNRFLAPLPCSRGNAWEGLSLSLKSPVSTRPLCAVAASRSYYPETEQSRIAQSTALGLGLPNSPCYIDAGPAPGPCKYDRPRGPDNPCNHNPRHSHFFRELYHSTKQPPTNRPKFRRCFRAVTRASSYLAYLPTSHGCPHQPGSCC